MRQRQRRRIAMWSIVALGLIGQAAWLLAEVSEARQTRRELAKKVQELHALWQQRPRPDEKTEERLRMRLEQLQAGCAGFPSAEAAPANASPVLENLDTADVYFRLAGHVERLRQAATRAAVEVASDERFGFQDYRHRGPERNVAATVLKQAEVLGGAIEQLFAAGPQQLVSVERASADAEWAASWRKDGGADDKLARATWCRVTFIGATATLRTVLNQWSAPTSLVKVRRVEVVSVEPKTRNEIADERETSEAPRVAGPGLCRFSVVIEPVEATP